VYFVAVKKAITIFSGERKTCFAWYLLLLLFNTGIDIHLIV